MSFYGIVIASIAALSIFGLSLVQHNSSAYYSLSTSFTAYERLQYLNAFRNLMVLPGSASNSTAYQSWLSAVEASARADGLNANVDGPVLVVSDYGNEPYYVVLRLNNT